MQQLTKIIIQYPVVYSYVYVQIHSYRLLSTMMVGIQTLLLSISIYDKCLSCTQVMSSLCHDIKFHISYHHINFYVTMLCTISKQTAEQGASVIDKIKGNPQCWPWCHESQRSVLSQNLYSQLKFIQLAKIPKYSKHLFFIKVFLGGGHAPRPPSISMLCIHADCVP